MMLIFNSSFFTSVILGFPINTISNVDLRISVFCLIISNICLRRRFLRVALGDIFRLIITQKRLVVFFPRKYFTLKISFSILLPLCKVFLILSLGRRFFLGTIIGSEPCYLVFLVTVNLLRPFDLRRFNTF